jgi:hypothetical protein
VSFLPRGQVGYSRAMPRLPVWADQST